MKKGMGRRKVEMKKIEKDKALQVCFSKRRQGVFKKASELSLLCGAHVAVIVFSPGGKPYIYAQPSLDSVINTITSSSNPTPPSSLPTDQQRRMDDLNREHAELLARMEAERARSRGLNLSLSELEMRMSNAEGMMSRRTEEISVPLEYANVGEPADRAGPLAAMWEAPVEKLEMWEEVEMEGVKEVMSRPPLPPLEYANVADPLAAMWEEVEMEGMEELMSRPPTPPLEYANVGVDWEVEERLFSPYFVGGGGGFGGGDDCGFFGCEQGFDSMDMVQFFC